MNPQHSYAIETRDLNYSFRSGSPKVVNNVSLQVPTGSIFGFLGPNGAGKTTTIRMITGMLENDLDNIFIQGKSLAKNTPAIFENIGSLIETPSLYLHLSGRDNLRTIARLRKIEENRVDEILKTVGLFNDRNRKANEYSLGMKQRLGVAMALLPNPSLLILDEPANGLDPAGIIEVRELLIRLNKELGKTIFVSSHLLSEVEKTCTHVSIIHKGTIRFQGAMADLQNSADKETRLVVKIKEAANYFDAVKEVFPLASLVHENEIIIPADGKTEISELVKLLIQKNIPVSGIQSQQGLEDWFIKLTSN